MSARGEICYKPGCGAANKVGDPCTDWDCPQRFVSAADYASLKAALTSSQEEIARLRKALVIANAQLADMEFLSVEGFLSWKSDRRNASQPVPEHGGRG